MCMDTLWAALRTPQLLPLQKSIIAPLLYISAADAAAIMSAISPRLPDNKQQDAICFGSIPSNQVVGHQPPPIAVSCGVRCHVTQELVDSARRLLDSNTSQLQQLCAKAGFTPPDDQGVHEAYAAAVKDWEGQMLQRYSGENSSPKSTTVQPAASPSSLLTVLANYLAGCT